MPKNVSNSQKVKMKTYLDRMLMVIVKHFLRYSNNFQFLWIWLCVELSGSNSTTKNKTLLKNLKLRKFIFSKSDNLLSLLTFNDSKCLYLVFQDRFITPYTTLKNFFLSFGNFYTKIFFQKSRLLWPLAILLYAQMLKCVATLYVVVVAMILWS